MGLFELHFMLCGRRTLGSLINRLLTFGIQLHIITGFSYLRLFKIIICPCPPPMLYAMKYQCINHGLYTDLPMNDLGEPSFNYWLWCKSIFLLSPKRPIPHQLIDKAWIMHRFMISFPTIGTVTRYFMY